MSIVIDPAVPNDELRRLLYAGHLVVLTRLHALEDFAYYTRGELTELFAPSTPSTYTNTSNRLRWRRSSPSGSLASSIPNSPRSWSAR